MSNIISILGPVGIDAGFPELYNPNAKTSIGDGTDSNGYPIVPTLTGRHDIPDGTIFIPTNPNAPIGNGTDSQGNVITFTPTGRVDTTDGTLFIPDTVLVTQREYIYIFYFININDDGINPPLYLGPNDYSDYNDFISSGVLPLANQTVSVSDETASVTVVKTIDQLELTISVSQRSTPSFVDNNYIIGKIEVWSRTLDSAGNIPASRRIDYIAGNDGLSFTYVGGNPGNRTYPGVLQPNGFYKSIFIVNLPLLGSDSFPSGIVNFYQNAKIFPYSVPPSADLIVYI